MCLIAFAWRSHPSYRLLLSGNRDERHDRPSSKMHWWPDQPDLLAGRDLQAGGTWLAASRHGRFATVTNYREPDRRQPGPRSRGEIVQRFVAGRETPREFAAALRGDDYAGFSLLCTDGRELWYLSNRGDAPQSLEPGIYGLSNAALDTPWPKLIASRAGLQRLIDEDRVHPQLLIRLLGDRTPAPAGSIDTGELPFEVAVARSAPFIVSPEYGTRCTSALLWSDEGRITLAERRFDREGKNVGDSSFNFRVEEA
jgi:uncharacterized protein with NRDE domain